MAATDRGLHGRRGEVLERGGLVAVAEGREGPQLRELHVMDDGDLDALGPLVEQGRGVRAGLDDRSRARSSCSRMPVGPRSIRSRQSGSASLAAAASPSRWVGAPARR